MLDNVQTTRTKVHYLLKIRNSPLVKITMIEIDHSSDHIGTEIIMVNVVILENKDSSILTIEDMKEGMRTGMIMIGMIVDTGMIMNVIEEGIEDHVRLLGKEEGDIQGLSRREEVEGSEMREIVRIVTGTIILSAEGTKGEMVTGTG
eukprot:TRINITY_DN20397_c0_g1_i1.p1 TRINITY_DN20397_c0_g1~~TRINITY_DN20397_c0_g1_i1.p1  ORF type:complete len:147 (+),score=2.74 TRINITY_DN20397_c0_g1_i1:328-768(+)